MGAGATAGVGLGVGVEVGVGVRLAVGGAVGDSTGVGTEASASVTVGVGVGLDGNLKGDAEVLSHAHKTMDSPAHKGSSDMRKRGFKSHTEPRGGVVTHLQDMVVSIDMY